VDTPRSIARVMLDIQDACYRLADGLGGPADTSEGGRAARDLGNLVGELATKMPVDHRAGLALEAVRDMIGDPTWSPLPGRTVTVTETHTVATFPANPMPLDEVFRNAHPDAKGRLPGSDGYEGCCPHPAIPDELVIDDDGPRAGVLRPVEPTDYRSGHAEDCAVHAGGRCDYGCGR
jgi:hypothetical protein